MEKNKKSKQIILTEENVKSIFYELSRSLVCAPKYHEHKELAPKYHEHKEPERYDDSALQTKINEHSDFIEEIDKEIEDIKKQEKIVFTNNLIGWLLVLVSLGFIFRSLMYWHIAIALFFIGVVLAIIGFAGMSDKVKDIIS